jgi:hypothetical protein
MGIGKISGHRAESLYSGSGICYVRTSFIASSASRSAQASAIAPSVQLIEAGEYCETLSLQLIACPTSRKQSTFAQMNGIWNARSKVCSQANC